MTIPIPPPINPTSIALFAVLVSWGLFVAAFAFRKRTGASTTTKSRPAARFGVLLEAVAYAIVWMGHRAPFTPPVEMGRTGEIAVAILAVGLAAGANWLTFGAIRTLGKQWAIEARVVEGHELALEGPYRFVRHPIYVAMFGLLVATGLVVSHPYALLGAVVLFWIGTLVRVKTEETLLRETFGTAYDEYAKRVPGIFGFD